MQPIDPAAHPTPPVLGAAPLPAQVQPQAQRRPCAAAGLSGQHEQGHRGRWGAHQDLSFVDIRACEQHTGACAGWGGAVPCTVCGLGGGGAFLLCAGWEGAPLFRVRAGEGLPCSVPLRTGEGPPLLRARASTGRPGAGLSCLWPCTHCRARMANNGACSLLHRGYVGRPADTCMWPHTVRRLWPSCGCVAWRTLLRYR